MRVGVRLLGRRLLRQRQRRAQTLIERWDGTSWAIVTSPNTAHAEQLPLWRDVRVGVRLLGRRLLRQRHRNSQTLIERWDGTSWAIVSSPNTSATQDNVLYGVTCVSASDCWAVGYDAGTQFVNSFRPSSSAGTGPRGPSSPRPTPPAQHRLKGVTCVSASDCWAVGSTPHPARQPYQTLIERWDGTSWAIVTSPNASATQDNVLSGVTCASASNCWAAGYYVILAQLQHQTLIERWDGTSWAIVSSPNTSATQSNILNGVTCVSASDCWAVGYTTPAAAGLAPDRALGRDLVDHRHLAQHADQLPQWRDVRVGVGLLGRRLLLHRQRRIRP